LLEDANDGGPPDYTALSCPHRTRRTFGTVALSNGHLARRAPHARELRNHVAGTNGSSVPLTAPFRPEIWTFDPADGSPHQRLDAGLRVDQVLAFTAVSCPPELIEGNAFVLFTFPPVPTSGMCFPVTRTHNLFLLMVVAFA
jgi:hypothetical protein